MSLRLFNYYFMGIHNGKDSGFLNLRKRDIILIGLTFLLSYGYMRFIYKVPGPTVQISTGKLRGAVARSRLGHEYYEFLGIPYAKPPIGQLRFEPPEPASKWEGVRDASRFGPACLQLDIVTGFVYGREDCLLINVYVPKSLKTRRGPLPVLVFIHGGLFTSGSADVVGADLIMDEEIIFVTFQYRLAALGFLNMGDEHIRGNMGLKDQRLALEWIQENIASFRGDPDKVTIFGESAGGASVHYHMLSPGSKGLFHKGISQSGTALGMWFFNKDPRPQARKFVRRLGCSKRRQEETIKCLKSVDPYKIIDIHADLLKPPRDPIDLFAPTVETVLRDDTFLASHPLDIIQNETFTKVPWIMGVNSHEGLIHSGEIIHDEPFMDWALDEWDDFTSRMLHFPKDPRISRRIKNFYFPHALHTSELNSTLEVFQELTNIFSDRVFFSSNHQTALLHAAHSPVYTYLFSHQGELDLVPFLWALRGEMLGHIATDIPVYYLLDFIERHLKGANPRRFGVCHGEEMTYQFSAPIVPYHRRDSPDFKMSRSFIRAWVDFAYDEVPLKFHNVSWAPLEPRENKVRYMDLNVKNPAMIDEPWTDRVNFWKALNYLH